MRTLVVGGDEVGPQVLVPGQAAELRPCGQLRMRPVLRLQRVAHHLRNRAWVSWNCGRATSITAASVYTLTSITPASVKGPLWTACADVLSICDHCMWSCRPP